MADLTTTAAVLATLRLKAGDVDEGRVAEAVAAVSGLILEELGPAAPDPLPADVLARYLTPAATKAAADMYQGQRAPGGWLETAGEVPVRVSADPLAGVLPLIDAAKVALRLPPGGFA